MGYFGTTWAWDEDDAHTPGTPLEQRMTVMLTYQSTTTAGDDDAHTPDITRGDEGDDHTPK